VGAPPPPPTGGIIVIRCSCGKWPMVKRIMEIWADTKVCPYGSNENYFV
jgi:hypothetical protein